MQTARETTVKKYPFWEGAMTSAEMSRDLQLDDPEDEEARAPGHLGLVRVSPDPCALSVVQISDGDGKFVLTTADPPLGVTVDIAAGALRLKSGRTVRWLALPEDALVDQAVIERSEEALVVTIPERNRRSRRNIVHVW